MFGVVSLDVCVKYAAVLAFVGVERFEFHLVFGQGARLVGEDGVDLA